MAKISKSPETESGVVIASGWGVGEKWKIIVNRYNRVTKKFKCGKNVPKVIMVIAA